MSGHRVFVYGTLQPGFHNWQRLLAGRVPRPWPAQIPGQLYDLPAGHPAVGEGEGWIRGYLLVLPNDALLARVDALEGFDPSRPQRANRYQRREVPCRTPTGAPLGRAYAYFMTPQRLAEEGAIPLAEGYWPPSA
mgnify:CR=1 FL=1